MATYVQNYTAAMKEFETLTSKRAATLKNIGKEQGLAKLSLIFKTGKTLEQRCADYDKVLAVMAGVKMTPAQATVAAKNVVTAHTKLNEGLKLNIAEFTKQAAVIGSVDAPMATGFDVLIKRLEQLKHGAKMEAENKVNQFKVVAKTAPVGDAKYLSDLKVCYLNIKKGCDETEALAKVAIARPTEANMLALLSSSTGPRSINVGVTGWKQLIKQRPSLPDELNRAGGADLVHLINGILDTTMKKPGSFWQAKLKTDQPGWEGRLKDEANAILKQVGHFRRTAEAMKSLAKP